MLLKEFFERVYPYTRSEKYYPSRKNTGILVLYETFQHTWMFDNVGKQTWRGRKLFFSNHAEVRPTADQIYIDIPDTPPNRSVTLTVTMDSRGFEGTYECKWIMIDSKGNDCYRNSSQFHFIVRTRFAIEK